MVVGVAQNLITKMYGLLIYGIPTLHLTQKKNVKNGQGITGWMENMLYHGGLIRKKQKMNNDYIRNIWRV